MPRSWTQNRATDKAKSIWKTTREKSQSAVKKWLSRKTKIEETWKPLKEFNFFERLPEEVRLMIWERIETRPHFLDLYHHVHIHSIRAFPNHDRSLKSKTFDNDKRFPSLCELPSSGEQDPRRWWDRFAKGKTVSGGVFLSTTAPPIHPFLRVCVESRDFLIRTHNLVYAFGAFINPDRDIIYLTSFPTFEIVWLSATCIRFFAKLLCEAELNHKIKKFAFDAVYLSNNMISNHAAYMKRQLNELKKLYIVRANNLIERTRWSPSNNIIFGVTPLTSPAFPNRQLHENLWAHVGSITPAVLYEHVIAYEHWKPKKLPLTKNHGVWGADDYYTLITGGRFNLRASDEEECCKKSIDEQD